MDPHLADMLVRESEPVGLEGGAGLALERLDHRLATARIARHRVHGERRRRVEQAGAHQRADEREKSGGIAAGVRDAGGAGDRIAPPRLELRETIGPGRIGAMRGRGVYDPRRRLADQGDRLARGLVG